MLRAFLMPLLRKAGLFVLCRDWCTLVPSQINGKQKSKASGGQQSVLLG